MLGLVLLLVLSLQTGVDQAVAAHWVAWLHLYFMTTAGAYMFAVPGSSCHQWTVLWK